jgi:AraC family transcriptional regulator of adaptative response/methylated-DNA-[protein]-cysteine methyltransferase
MSLAPKSPRYATDAQKWIAVRHRDPRADGVFVFSVKTTRVYCRPSCASRPPRRENVAFHDSCAAAERAGFRPCKRCRPDGPSLAAQHASMVARACQILATRDPVPSLPTLARELGLSAPHFHRVFTRVTGLSPKACAGALRAESVRRHLSKSPSVTEALHAAGYSSSGRFYAEASRQLGMKPKRFLRGGDGETIRFACGKSSLGPVLVAASEKGVCAILLGDDLEELARDLARRFPRATLLPGDRAFGQTVAAVIRRVEDPRAPLALLPLDLRGTLFQQKVWRALAEIPLGQTATYAAIARRLGRPKAARAVAAACAANPLAVAVPCHRVVRSDASLSGYRWGIPRKRALLARESGGPCPAENSPA